MDGDERTGEPEPVAHFGQRGVRVLLDDGDHAAPVRVGDHRLPSCPVIKRADLASGFALLDKLFHHAQRYAEPIRDSLTRVSLLIVTGEYSLADIKG